MQRGLKWRTIALVGAILACAAILLPNVVDRQALPWPLRRFKPLGLGLDLQGGSRIVYTIDLDKAVDDRASDIRRDLETRFTEDAALTTKPTVRTPSSLLGAVSVTVPEGARRAEIEATIQAECGDTTEPRECGPDDGAGAICFRVSASYAEGIKKAALANAVNTIRERIDEKGVAEPTVIQKDDQIVVELPGLDDQRKDETREVIARTAKLEFKIVDDGSDYMRRLFAHVGSTGKPARPTDPAAIQAEIFADVDQWRPEEGGGNHTDYFLMAHDRQETVPVSWAKQHGCLTPDSAVDNDRTRCTVTGRQVIERYLFGDKDLAVKGLVESDPTFKVPDDHQIGFELEEPPADTKDSRPYWRTYYLDRAVRLTGTGITNEQPSYDPNTGRPIVLLDFNRSGSRVFGDLTAQIVGKKLATILDDRVKSAPIINGAIRGGRASITMGGSDVRRQEHERDGLVNVLKSGSLPAPLREESVSDLGPTLGRDAIQKTRLSFILGVLLVVALMVGFYRKSGWVAVFAVMFHVLVTLAVMALFEATLTLPGIAALVLSVGMCVDGNILINERIRDELLLGKSVRGAIDLGFSRAFSAILDGQFTIAASAFVLLQYGSGPIKGFAVMMLVGVFTTVATNTWVTRILFDWGTSRDRNATTLSI
jgi:preprotein translocase subunit SecD